jgi:hypothetical protein
VLLKAFRSRIDHLLFILKHHPPPGVAIPRHFDKSV